MLLLGLFSRVSIQQCCILRKSTCKCQYKLPNYQLHVTVSHTSKEVERYCVPGNGSWRIAARDSSSPVIPVRTAVEHHTRPKLFPELDQDPIDNEKTTQTPQANKTLLANFEKKVECAVETDDEDRYQTACKLLSGQHTAGTDSTRSSDSENYDFIPGTPPSKKVIIKQ